jgi:hypothetical protein
MGGTANTPAEAATTSMRYKVETKNQSYTAAVAGAYTTGDRTATITCTGTAGMAATAEPIDSTFVNGIKTTGSSTGWYFAGTSTTAGKYVRFQFSTAQTLVEATCYKDNAGSNTYGVWKWQGSNDASSWTDIGSSFTLGGGSSFVQTELSGNTTAYTYYQWLGVSGNYNSTHTITEIEFKTVDIAASGKVTRIHGTSLAWK